MKQIVLVFIGGGLGSVLRYLLSKILNYHWIPQIPLGTFVSNIIGCFLMGLVLGWSHRNYFLNSYQTLFLATGFCGGFTTFSSFAFEKVVFLKAGDIFNFSLYLLASITVGITAIFFGLWLSKQ